MRDAAYTCFSTEEQAEAGHSLEAQLDAIRRLCGVKGFTMDEVHAERGKSGKTDKRHEFQRLLANIRDRRIDTMIVHKLDRFPRILE